MGTVEWIVLLSVGVLVGLGLGFFLGRLGGRGNSQKLADAEAELETYRQSVTEHFSQSAEHFQAIGRQYRELYEHMAAGSEKLCVDAPSDGQLKFPRPDEVSRQTPENAEDTSQSAESDTAEGASDADQQHPDTESADADSPAKAPSTAELSASEEPEKDSESVDAADGEESPDSKPAKAEKAELESATAPADYASDDPKDRRYH